ncbi:site-specific integrase [Amnibacterium sp. CER49]|uniref:tyrosine-type recombinase/integrase n=1 Tax=Amnibacterium sp. CER49 TaxID=3039161 RepID=UPI002446F793|nr:site-specific integrase [Amnibacterium sp. CER49]MDH2442923.1 site-specific integrase [Amnibacterium sp. CER49]
MTTGRPELALGTHGRIHLSQAAGIWRARVRVRDFDGVTRQLQRAAKTRGGAEQALQLALRDRGRSGAAELITGDSRVADVAAQWFTALESQSPSTRQAYADQLRRQILPALGKVRIRELSVGLVDRHLATIRAQHGPATARVCRSVLSGICGLAVRHDALPTNPCRDVARIPGTPKRRPTALTATEVRELHTALLQNPRAVTLDLPDLVAFLAATGARIGEACAVSWHDVDLEAGTVHLHGTVLRLKGQGLVVGRSKSPSGDRIIEPPPWCMQMLRSRAGARSRGAVAAVFPAPFSGGLRDPSNTRRGLRQAFDAAGRTDLTSHVFRRTVATLMDAAGMSARDAADQFGHAHPSLTLDHYMGRRARSTGAATVLQELDLWPDDQQPPSTIWIIPRSDA